MKSKKALNARYLICILCIITIFSIAGYFFITSSPTGTAGEDTWTESGFLRIGRNLVIQKADDRLSLLDSKDILSANGLYYATWTIGGAEPYENSDGETVDLYDAQLYFVLAEHKTGDEAQKDMTKWMDAAKGNYSILTEEEITCNGQLYRLITYQFANENSPYDRGVSAFGVNDTVSVCAELTCRKNFSDDLKTILTLFLEQCAYGDTSF